MNSQTETRIERRPVRKPRACHQCHSRKVRCDAWQVGVPCTRCRRRNQERTCVLVGSVANPERLPRPHSIQPRASRHPQKPATDCICAGQPRRVSVADGGSVHPNVSNDSFASPLPCADRPTKRRCSPGVGPVTPQSAAHDPHHRDHVPQPTDTHNHSREDMVDLLCHNDLETPDASSAVSSVDEEDVHVRLAEDMSREFVGVVSPTEPQGEDECCEVIEYHEGVTPVTILGEALGKRMPNRLTRVKLRGSTDSGIDLTSGIAGFDLVDTAYLQQKGALVLPPRKVLTQLFHLYFKCVFPYAPILEPAQFVRDYYAGRHSPFLMQSVLAGVIPHTPVDLLSEMGYQDRMAAQKAFYSRATLIYDLGHERSQLSRLQGSIMLSSLSFSYAGDKDYRYWFSNACRIATQMGLHRQYISERLDPTSKKLFRRIWWTLYNRDVLMAVSGLCNLKKFDDRFCDTAALTEDDWTRGDIPDDLNWR
ncbi:hypothetical protein NM208_g14751 [Fusarium decemcellulare]|uniref:Uncharacterized protein n=1 Tax=Fusarium decemcellulare TaxID=57161 RepID=A0ACC1RGV3_9HYPO|nr:hypothetical protein NM208_g14751 [Fusarium decemcellulare]